MPSKKKERQDYLIGKVFNRLTVLDFDGWDIKKNGTRISRWKCLCSCGNYKMVQGSSLVGNLTKSCGCLAKETSFANGIKTGHPEGGFNDLWNIYNRGAKLRDLDFLLTRERFKELTSKNCHYCNIEPLQIRKTQSKYKMSNNYIYNGIDRIDSSIGYIEGNCLPCCHKCNVMKKNHSYDDFIKHITTIINNINKTNE